MRMRPYIALLATIAAVGCGPSAGGESQAVVPELKLDDVRFRIYRGDALKTFGEAEGASLRRDSSDVRAEQLEATIPHRGQPVHVSAPRGEGSLLSRVFTVSGGVVATRGGDVARTPAARYEPASPPQAPLSTPWRGGGAEGLVRGDGPVVLEGDAYRLEGAGFTLDPAAGTIVVGGGAKLLAGIRRAP
jgi:lipopolysaccharide export system protein LptC